MCCTNRQRLAPRHFPTTSIVSMLYVMESGSSAEIAVVGNEGIAVSPVHGGETTPVVPWAERRARVSAKGQILKDESIVRER
jgi:hypothetical protein